MAYIKKAQNMCLKMLDKAQKMCFMELYRKHR